MTTSTALLPPFWGGGGIVSPLREIWGVVAGAGRRVGDMGKGGSRIRGRGGERIRGLGGDKGTVGEGKRIRE